LGFYEVHRKTATELQQEFIHFFKVGDFLLKQTYPFLLTSYSLDRLWNLAKLTCNRPIAFQKAVKPLKEPPFLFWLGGM
jgi:hypothetical protein